MKTVVRPIGSLKLAKTVDILFPADVEILHDYLEFYEGYCGPGRGVIETVIPDKFIRRSVSFACYVHDKMFEHAEPTWESFHYCNSVFLHNMISIIDATSGPFFMRWMRLSMALTYYMAVDSSIGAKVFWDLKKKG